MAALTKRIQGRSFRELLVRAAQQWEIFRELTSAARRREMTDSELLGELLVPSRESLGSSNGRAAQGAISAIERIRSRFQTRPVIRSLECAPEIAWIMAWRFPEERLAIIGMADRAISGDFDIFGKRRIYFGSPINWRLEPLSGKQTPLAHWSRIDYLDQSVAGDKKVTWELSRHQHFIAFGQAYLMTDDEKYARAFVDQATSWMDQNPPNLGINWSSSLELAFRSIAWIWAISLFAHSESLSGLFLKRLVKYLIAHAQHIETHLSTYFSPNTHLTGEALGLLYLGISIPECRRAREWRQKGLNMLVEQMRKQVRADGVYFEQSSYYHRYTVDFYLSLLQIARENGIDLPSDIEPSVERMIDYLMWVTRPDGTPTLLGDDDGGRLRTLSSRDAYDFTDSIAWGAATFGRGRWKYIAGDRHPDLLWQLGPGGLEQYDRLSAERPRGLERAFSDAGQFVARDGWESDSSYLHFRCGPPGALSGAHDHADQLSFELFANGTAWLVDPGTRTYTADGAVRNQFRLTQAHNTLTVDDLSQSLPSGPFSWRSRATGVAEDLIPNHRFTCASGSQNGYSGVPFPVKHQRTVMMLKRVEGRGFALPAYVIVTDDVESDSEHSYELRYHFDSDIAVASTGTGFIAYDRRGNLLRIGQFATTEFSSGTSAGQISRHYGQREAATVGWVKAAAAGRHRFASVVLPIAYGCHEELEISRFATRTGDCISVQLDNVQDLFMFGDGEIRTDRLALQSSARITWIRREGPRLLTAAIIDGSCLAIDGLFQLRSSSQPRYIAADLDHRRISVYTDDPDSLDLQVDSELLDVEINGNPEVGLAGSSIAEQMAGLGRN